jgi:hypothetical protein
MVPPFSSCCVDGVAGVARDGGHVSQTPEQNLRRWWLVTERLMWSHRIVMPRPALDYDLSLPQ